MARFSMYLPPFAPDYSGVCSALFDLNALVVIHDACGCTANYTGFDEPRWYGSSKAVYCSGLRETDAIFGNEDKFLGRIERAFAERSNDFAAFVGSPVPMVMGTDFTGFAKEMENRLNVPAFGFDTNGTEYYNTGSHMAGASLLERFTDAPQRTKGNRSVNILGATHLDIDEENLSALCDLLTVNGFGINSVFFMGLTLEQVKRAGEAALNVAISQSGARLARYMEQRFNIPYVVGLPIGASGETEFLNALKLSEAENKNIAIHAEPHKSAEYLVIGDEVFSHSVKFALEKDGYGLAHAGAIFGSEKGLYEGTLNFRDERSIISALRNGGYTTVIADPLICDLAPSGMKTIPVSQYAVSSKLRLAYRKRYIGDIFGAMI